MRAFNNVQTSSVSRPMYDIDPLIRFSGSAKQDNSFLRLAPRLTASVVSMSIEQPTHNPYHSCSSTDQLENNCNREHEIENY